MSEYQKPVPVVTANLSPFFEGAKRHDLVIQK